MENISDIKESVYDIVLYQTRVRVDTMGDNIVIPADCKYEISCDLSEEFDIELDIEDMETINTVGELVTVVEEKIKSKENDDE